MNSVNDSLRGFPVREIIQGKAAQFHDRIRRNTQETGTEMKRLFDPLLVWAGTLIDEGLERTVIGQRYFGEQLPAQARFAHSEIITSSQFDIEHFALENRG